MSIPRKAVALFFGVLLCVAPVGTDVALGQGLPTGRAEDVGLSSRQLAKITPVLQSLVDSGKLAGVVAMVARHGKLVYTHAVGRRDVTSDAALRIDDVFRIYSMTKPVIAAAILKLADQGKLRLDDPVAKFIPAFGATKVYAGGPSKAPMLKPPSRPMTIEHLLTPTSGLTYGFFTQTPVDTIYRDAQPVNRTRTVEQFADSIARLPLAFSPGDAWNYSYSIDVAGRVVEVASGRPLDVFLAEEIFRPLGMYETAFHVLPSMTGRIMALHSRVDGALRPDAQLLSASYLPSGRFLSGGGGLLSTAPDYIRFAQMLLNKGELEGHRVLSRASVDNMVRNHLAPSLTPIVSPLIGYSGYGYGLGGAVLLDSAAAGIGGSPGIYRWWGIMGTFFWIDPKTDLVGMVWTQFNNGIVRLPDLEPGFQRLVYSAVLAR